MQLYWMSSYMKFNSCGGVKTPWYFLKNYSMVSTDALQVGFLSSLTIVNEGSSLTIVNETTNFIKTIVLKTTIFKKTNILKKRSFLKTIISFSILRRRYHNETIVFLKNENVNIPTCRPPFLYICSLQAPFLQNNWFFALQYEESKGFDKILNQVHLK